MHRLTGLFELERCIDWAIAVAVLGNALTTSYDNRAHLCICSCSFSCVGTQLSKGYIITQCCDEKGPASGPAGDHDMLRLSLIMLRSSAMMLQLCQMMTSCLQQWSAAR